MAEVGRIDFSRKRTFGQANLLSASGQAQSEFEPRSPIGVGEYEYEEHGQNENIDAEDTVYENDSNAYNQPSPSSPDQVRNENAEEDDEPEPEIKPKRSLFSCDICNATFVTSLSLKRHNLVYHEGEEAIQCPSCQRMFFNQDDLIIHVADEHRNQKGKADERFISDQDSDALQDGDGESESCHDQETKYEAEDEEPDDLDETATTPTNYTRLDKLCEGAEDDDELDEQPVSDPFADDGDEIPEPEDTEEGEAYNEYGEDADVEEDLCSSQNKLSAGAGARSLIETKSTLQQFQHRSLLRKAFKQTQIRGKAVAVSFNGGQGQKSQAHHCPECGADFMTRVNMQRHMLSHGQDRPHKCQLCDKGFVRKEHLFKHLSSVHSGLKFTCEFCGKDISRKDHLLRHIRHVHPSEYLRIPPELLNAQNLESLSSDNLRAAGFEISDKALNSMQPKPKKPFLNCDMCPATFTLLNDLYTHQSEAHSDVRKHKCPDCPKAFKRREHLTKHEVLHSGAKKFRCALCGKAFPRKDALTDHIRRLHSAPGPADKTDNGFNVTATAAPESDNFPGMEYPCNFCDKVFLQQENLIRHLQGVHRITLNLPVPGQRPIPTPAAFDVFDPMNLTAGRIAPKPAAPAVRSVSRVSQQQHLIQSSLQPKPKTILPKQPKQDAQAVTSLRQAQQHLNKISGGKSSITISAIPSPLLASVTPVAAVRTAAHAPVRTQAAVARVVPAIKSTASVRPTPVSTRPTIVPQPRTVQISANTVNKIVIKKIGDYMKAIPVSSVMTLPSISVVNNVNNYGQAQVQIQQPIATTSPATVTAVLPSFPCSYCNAVYSDEKIFRIHMNSHNADMN